MPGAGFGQQFIGQEKSTVKKELSHSAKKDDQARISINDTSLVYHYQDAASGPVDRIYSFDKTSKCISEKSVAGCENCYVHLLQSVLEQKKYEWKKLNENQYISKYSESLMLELPHENNEFTFTVFKIELNKELYKVLTGN